MNGAILPTNVVVDSIWCHDTPQRPIELQVEFDSINGTKVLVVQCMLYFAVPLGILMGAFFVTGGFHTPASNWGPFLIGFGMILLLFALALGIAFHYIQHQRLLVISSHLIVTQGLLCARHNQLQIIPLNRIRHVRLRQDYLERFFNVFSLILELFPMENLHQDAVHLRGITDALRIQQMILAKTRSPAMIPKLRTIVEIESVASDMTTTTKSEKLHSKSERPLSIAPNNNNNNKNSIH